MEFFDALFTALAANPLAAIVAVLLISFGWLFLDMRKREEAHALKVASLYEAHAKAMGEANVAHLQTALQVAPLASKLVTCVEVLERLSNATLHRGANGGS